MAFSPRCRTWTAAILLFLGLAFIILAIVLPWVVNKKFDSTLDEKLSLGDSEFRQSWSSNNKSDSAMTYKKFYFWNVTNVVDFMNGDILKLVQVGPYAFRQYKVRFDLKDLNVGGEDMLQYKERVYFAFDPAASFPGASVDDVVTSLSLVTAKVYSNAAPFLNACVMNVTCKNLESVDGMFTPFWRRTVGQIFWGYDSPLLENVRKFSKGMPSHFDGLSQGNQTTEEAALAAGVLPSVLVVGKQTKSRRAEFYKFDNSTKIWAENPVSHEMFNPWGSDDANTIQGTDGTIFSRPVKAGQQLKVFIDSLSRWAYIVNKDGHEVDYKGVSLLRFSLRPQDMLNATNNKANTVYNSFGYNGVMNLTGPAGMPIFVSKPHFMDADAAVRSQVQADFRSGSDLQTFIDVEPNTGMTMNAAKRLQINFNFEPSKFKAWSKCRPTLIPAFWLEESGGASQSQVDKLKDTLSMVSTTKQGIQYGGFIGGGVLVLIGLFFVFYNGKKFEEGPIYHEMPDTTR